MSFSINVKNEIINIINSRHCAIAEFSAIINYIGKIKKDDEKYYLIFNSENENLLKKCQTLIEYIFEEKIYINYEKNKSFNIIIKDKEFINKIFKTIKQKNGIQDDFNSSITNSICCKRAYIRGAFVCIGYISDPEKNYHLEFTNLSFKQAENLRDIINFFEIGAKILEKKESYIVYIKEGEQIVDLLNIIEAHQSLLELENIRIIKDVRNNINRIVNCETANLNKIVSNGIKQKEDIEFIKNEIGLDTLPKQLKDIAKLRLNHPDISLKELGEMLNPTISKSGVNHRLKKINKIAESLRGN